MHLYPKLSSSLPITPALAPISFLCAARSELEQARSRGCSCVGSGHRRLCLTNLGTLKSSPPQTPAHSSRPHAPLPKTLILPAHHACVRPYLCAQLNLSGNYLDQEVAAVLAPAIAVCASLTRLDAGVNDLGEEGKAMLRKAVEGRSGFELQL